MSPFIDVLTKAVRVIKPHSRNYPNCRATIVLSMNCILVRERIAAISSNQSSPWRSFENIEKKRITQGGGDAQCLAAFNLVH